MLSRLGRNGLSIVGCVLAVGLTGGMLAVPTSTALPMQSFRLMAAQPPSDPENSNPTNPGVEASKVHAQATTEAAQPPSASGNSNPTNPVVEPGKVHWHATTEDALYIAKWTKKPVLVFHMMGQLDHQFC